MIVPEIVWEDPPPTNLQQDNTYKYEAMREHPGKWMIFGVYSHSYVGTMKQNRKHEGFEFTGRFSHKNDKGIRQDTVYARYVGS